MARSPATDSAALINAAAAVFKSKGYRNATIDDIADAAGVSRPTVYKYTQNKRALLDSMVDAVLDAIAARLHEVLAGTGSPAGKLRRLIAIHVETATSMQTFYGILFSEEAELSDEARARSARSPTAWPSTSRPCSTPASPQVPQPAPSIPGLRPTSSCRC